MSNAVMQHSFHAGEWAPALNARVDVAKYKSGAALMKNFFPDYRGGASSRSGTMYCLQCYRSGFPVRLIPFQVNFTTNFVLEFGQNYIRPFFQGAPILESTNAITAATKANPCVLSVVNSYNVGDWIFVAGVVGMTQLNNRYFQVIARTGGTVTLGDLNGNNINSTGFNTYTSGGTTARVFTISSPYNGSDLALLKFAQNINTLVLCHPSYAPRLLTIISSTNWTLTTISFGSTINSPTNVNVTTTLAGGTANYSYAVTAVDINGQESPPAFGALSTVQDIRTTAGTNTVTFTASPGAVSYNVYRAQIVFGGAVPAGSDYGFAGNCSATTFVDSNIAPDFTTSPPVVRNPFVGAPVQAVNVTGAGSYATVPGVTIAPPASGLQATGQAALGVISTGAITPSRGGFVPGQLVNMVDGTTGSPITNPVLCSMQILTVDGSGNPTSVMVINQGSVTSGSVPATLVNSGAGGFVPQFFIAVQWGVVAVLLTSGGAGYTAVPAVTFSAGAATAVAVLGVSSAGNPSVPTYYQQRLVLAGPPGNPQQFNMSVTGSYFNYNVSNPVQPDDAIQGTLVSVSLQNIKSMLPMSTGLIILSDKAAWLLNGGSIGSAVTPASLVANQHSYNGASDVPPIVSNFDILYVQSKGSIVRDLTFNFYAQIYTGTDISILSSHLFYGHTIKEWCYAEEPFKIVWAVRDDGALLSLTYLKEQDIVGWAQHDTDGGLGGFASCCSVVESRPTTDGRNFTETVDAPYFVVQRLINGVLVQYIERMAERFFSGQAKYAWTVDSALQYNGTPTTTINGLFHLIGKQVYGLADGLPVGPFTVSAQGSVTLLTPASLVTLGLLFTPKLQTLRLDLGEPTVQGKRKKITAVTVRCQETLGLEIGKDFGSTMVPMKDLQIGNIGSMSNQLVTDLVTDDARTIIAPSWDVPGEYCIQAISTYPATILGVIPEFTVGDTPERR